VAIDTDDDFKTMVLGASVCHTQYGVEAALAGDHAVRYPFQFSSSGPNSF